MKNNWPYVDRLSYSIALKEIPAPLTEEEALERQQRFKGLSRQGCLNNDPEYGWRKNEPEPTEKQIEIAKQRWEKERIRLSRKPEVKKSSVSPCWVSPNGKIISCDYAKHNLKAVEICQENKLSTENPEHELEKRNWIKVTFLSSDYEILTLAVPIEKLRITESQKNAIYEIMSLSQIKKDFKSYLQLSKDLKNLL